VAAAKNFDIKIETFVGRDPEELKAAFSKIAESHFDGLLVGVYSNYDIYARYIYELALDLRLPSMTWSAVQCDRGALFSYASPIPEFYRIAATLVRRILSGEKPANLPVQQPTKFELSLNMKTAKALGLKFSSQFLGIVDRVID
jgi:putative tryptophan/tyrosine transport system substrate-binding protein